ncbi:hypothetical protein HQ487_01720 [Candidatus Uhrbacteria bacterium]|nr:hypothetical protein [Candidatus Uhrbacteria bacterium]
MLLQALEAVTGTMPADLRYAVMSSHFGGQALSKLGQLQTPGIVYLSGRALLNFDPRWYNEIEAITRAEEHLLTKTRADLEPAAKNNQVTIAIDTTQQNRVVGCIVLWELERDRQGVLWYELGTFVVAPDHRYKARGPKAMPIGDALYRLLLHQHRNKNIIGTTTNIHAIHTGLRHGMQMVSYHDLPPDIHTATCICPFSKTGAEDNAHCTIKNLKCRVRVSYPTWVRMGQPTRLSFPS